jgi:hypothetical protein
MMPLLVGIGLALFVAAAAHIIGWDRDRAFYSVVLTVVGSYYILFAVMGGGEVVAETLAFGLFATLAILGFRFSPWLLVVGLALHGLFDFVRPAFLAGEGVPSWWPAFCGGYDIAAAAALALLLTGNRKKAY